MKKINKSTQKNPQFETNASFNAEVVISNLSDVPIYFSEKPSLTSPLVTSTFYPGILNVNLISPNCLAKPQNNYIIQWGDQKNPFATGSLSFDAYGITFDRGDMSLESYQMIVFASMGSDCAGNCIQTRSLQNNPLRIHCNNFQSRENRLISLVFLGHNKGAALIADNSCAYL